MTDNLEELAREVEQGEGADRVLDIRVYEALGLVPEGYARAVVHGAPQSYFWHIADTKAAHVIPPQFTASLDAVAALLPGWAFPLLDWRGSHCRMRNALGIDFPRYVSLARTAERAFLAATLRLLAGQASARR